MTALDRFMRFVEPAIDGCWHWSGALFIDTGYGAFRLNGQAITAHRASLILLAGMDPGEKHGCHKCDVRCCVRPEHLFVGTPAQNVHDMISKGRNCRHQDRVAAVLAGRRVALRKLTEEDVLQIIPRIKAKEPARKIASDFGVHKDTITCIGRGDTWSHLTGIPCRRHHWKAA